VPGPPSRSWCLHLPTIDAADLAKFLPVIQRYADHAIGVADASNVLLADRYRTVTIATLDRRHFSLLQPLNGGYFAIVP